MPSAIGAGSGFRSPLFFSGVCSEVSLTAFRRRFLPGLLLHVFVLSDFRCALPRFAGAVVDVFSAGSPAQGALYRRDFIAGVLPALHCRYLYWQPFLGAGSSFAGAVVGSLQAPAARTFIGGALRCRCRGGATIVLLAAGFPLPAVILIRKLCDFFDIFMEIPIRLHLSGKCSL